jgi:hypothetical protein
MTFAGSSTFKHMLLGKATAGIKPYHLQGQTMIHIISIYSTRPYDCLQQQYHHGSRTLAASIWNRPNSPFSGDFWCHLPNPRETFEEQRYCSPKNREKPVRLKRHCRAAGNNGQGKSKCSEKNPSHSSRNWIVCTKLVAPNKHSKHRDQRVSDYNQHLFCNARLNR